MANTFKTRLNELYTGVTSEARAFRLGLILFDFTTIIVFVALAPFPGNARTETFGFVIGLLILADFSARLWIADDRKTYLKKIYNIADVVVIASLLIAPFIAGNLAFLRILRGLRIIHSYHLLGDLRRVSPFFRDHEDATIAAVNLLVFVFFTTSVVFALFVCCCVT